LARIAQARDVTAAKACEEENKARTIDVAALVVFQCMSDTGADAAEEE